MKKGTPVEIYPLEVPKITKTEEITNCQMSFVILFIPSPLFENLFKLSSIKPKME